MTGAGIGPGVGRLRQAAIYGAGAIGRRPRLPTSAADLEQRARRAMSRTAFAYVAGGAGRADTVRANADGFDAWRIVPRVLRDVSRRDLTVDLLGRTLPAPVLLGPVGVLSLAHREADLAVARAASTLGLPMVFSNQASVAMEDCARVMGGSPRWFQLYWSTIDELVESFVSRAEACGCEALVVTLDTTMLGWRPRDLDLGSLPFAHGAGIAQYTSDPVFRRLAERRAVSPSEPGPTPRSPTPRSPTPRSPTPRPTIKALQTLVDIARNHPGGLGQNLRSPIPRAAVQLFLESYSRPSITWDDLGWLRERTRLPLVLKGILHPDDAREAVERGADAVVVSTHGGRQVDGSVGAVAALPAVVDAVGGRIPVLLDSGVRGGADIVKALALGAQAVLVGRPWVYGLALAGEDGVREVVENLVAEFDLTLGLAGCASARDATSITLTR